MFSICHSVTAGTYHLMPADSSPWSLCHFWYLLIVTHTDCRQERRERGLGVPGRMGSTREGERNTPVPLTAFDSVESAGQTQGASTNQLSLQVTPYADKII